MLKALISLVFVVLIAFGFLWLNENSTFINFMILDYDISISPVVVICFLSVIVFVLCFAIKIISYIFNLPKLINMRLRDSHYKRSIESLVALYNSTVLEDGTINKKLEQALNNIGKLDLKLKLGILDLQYKILNELEGKVDADFVLSQYIGHFKGDERLFMINMYCDVLLAKSDYQKVYRLLNDNIDILNEKLSLIYIKSALELKRYNDLYNTLNNKLKKILAPTYFNSVLSSCVMELARECYALSQFNEMSEYSQAAIKIDELNKEGYLLHLLSLIGMNNSKSSISKFVIKNFDKAQSEAFVAKVFELLSKFTPLEFYEMSKEIFKVYPNSIYAGILIAKASMEMALHDEAFKAISHLTEKFGKTKIICILMAEFAFRTQGSSSEVLHILDDALKTI